MVMPLPPSLMQPPPPGMDPLQNPDLIAFLAQSGLGGPPMPPPPGMDPFTAQGMGMGGPPPIDPMMMGGLPPLSPFTTGEPTLIGGPPPGMPMDPMAMMGPIGPPPPEPDPLAFLDEPVPEDMLGLLATPREPVYPPWYYPPPKPSKDDIDEITELLRNDERSYVNRVRADVEILNAGITGRGIGVFKGNEKKDLPFHIPTMVNDRLLLISTIGAIDPFIDVPYKDPSVKEETQQAEDFLRKTREDEIRQHARRGHGDLGMDEVDDITSRGRVVCRQVMDLSDPDEPFDCSLLDATQVFALRSQKRGLEVVVHVYSDTVAGVIGDFDDESGKLRKKLTKGNEARKLTDVVEVRDYWDSWWRCVLIDGEPGLPISEHKYGEPPFIIQSSGIGGAHPIPNDADLLDGISLTEQDAGKYRDGSFIHWRKRVHHQHEAIMSRLFTEFKKTENPSWLLARDEIAAGKERPKIRTEGGNVNEVEMNHEALTPLVTAPPPNVFGPLLAASDAANRTSGLPDAMYGVNDKSNVSGFATVEQTDAGMEKMAPWLRSMERYHEGKYEQRLRFMRNHGHLIVDPETGEPGGKVTVTRSRPTRKQTPAFVFSPDVLDRTGTRVQVKMIAVKQRNLGALTNVGLQLVNAGIKTERWLREETGDPDPDRTADEVLQERIKKDERWIDIFMLKAARNTEDPIASKLLEEAVQAKRAESQAPPPGPAGAPGMMPPTLPGGMPRRDSSGVPTGGGGGPHLPPNPGGFSIPSIGGRGPGPGSGPPGALGPRGFSPPGGPQITPF